MVTSSNESLFEAKKVQKRWSSPFSRPKDIDHYQHGNFKIESEPGEGRACLVVPAGLGPAHPDGPN